MYNILVPVEKKWREPFLRFVALFEIVSIPLLIVLKRVLVKDGNLIYSNYPVRYSCIDLMFVDFLQYKFRFIFFGVKANQMFIMDKIEEMQIQRDQSGRRKSRRNIFIRNEFEMYKSIVNSNLYEKIIFNSILFGDALMKIEKAKNEYQKIKSKEQELIYSKRKLSFDKIQFPDSYKETMNAIIEYEYFCNNSSVDFVNPEFSKVKKYLGDKYANRVDSLDKDRLDDIIGKLNYIEKVTFSKATIRESIKWSNQSLKIAIYFKNDEVKKKIEERLDFLKKEYSKWI